MKKFISTILAAAVVLSTGSALAYTDVAEDDSRAEAIVAVTGYDIMFGYDDGTFRPEETLTRADAAAYVCRALGLDEPSPAVTAFSDVPQEHWASGCIDLAYQEGFVDGCGDGTFRPDDPINYEDAVKMVVAALGYGPEASAKGGYRVGYLAVAAQNKITVSAGGVVGQPVTRGTFARLIYNSLDVGMLVQVSWGDPLVWRVEESRTLRSILEPAVEE